MLTSELTWSETDDLSDPAVANVQQNLRAFNVEQVGSAYHRHPVVLSVRGADREFLGGLVGDTLWGWLHTNLLWVAASAQRRGLGAELMQRAEAIGKRRGAQWARVKTASFQALPFYRKQGYEIFAQLPLLVDSGGGAPQQHTDYYLRKTLIQPNKQDII